MDSWIRFNFTRLLLVIIVITNLDWNLLILIFLCNSCLSCFPVYRK